MYYPNPLVVLLLAVGLISQVTAQATTTAQCTTALWTINHEGVSPCLVAAALQGACNGGKFNVPLLTPGQQYAGPNLGLSNGCSCSTVTYSMVAACGACQGSSVDTWSDWITNCSKSDINISKFPLTIPLGTSIPAWAYLDVIKNNIWDPSAAQTDANNGAPDSSATGPTATGISGSPQKSNGSSTPVAAIAGGVAGGVVGLLLIVGLVFFFIRRSKNNKTISSHGPSADGVEKLSTASPQSPIPYATPFYANASGVPETRYYDPSDPSTFPATPAPASQGYSSPSLGGQRSSSSYLPNPIPQPYNQSYTGYPAASPQASGAGMTAAAPVHASQGYSSPPPGSQGGAMSSTYVPNSQPYQQSYAGYSQAASQGTGVPPVMGYSGTPEL